MLIIARLLGVTIGIILTILASLFLVSNVVWGIIVFPILFIIGASMITISVTT